MILPEQQEYLIVLLDMYKIGCISIEEVSQYMSNLCGKQLKDIWGKRYGLTVSDLVMYDVKKTYLEDSEEINSRFEILDL